MDKVTGSGIRRVVTAHNEEGKAIIKYDDEQPRIDITEEHATFAVLWTTNSSPVDNMDSRDGAQKPVFSGSSHNSNGGSVLRFVDFPPHTASPMHRTQSIDYGIVIWGELELELDGGDKTTLGPSDVCVQRGTNHLWRNTSDKWTRVAYILLDAQPIIINGEKLPDEGFTGDQSGDHH